MAIISSLKKSVFNTLFHIKQRVRIFLIARKAKQYISKGIFPVEIKSDYGIATKMIMCLEILLYCKEQNLTPFFKFSYKNSRPEDDYFNAFFTMTHRKEQDPRSFITIRRTGDLRLGKDYWRSLTVELANSLIREFIAIRPEITKEADDFCTSTFEGKQILGVHYRGTDKGSEAPTVTYESVLKNIVNCLAQYDILRKIFITTDDMNFIRFMKTTHLSDKVFFREDFVRSDDGAPVHLMENTDSDYYNINKDAVVNLLILSKCSFIIKSASALSSYALLLNPQIPFMMLNRPFDNTLWFPESELIKITAMEPVI